MTRQALVPIAVSLFAFLVAGCNTERLWIKQEKLDAPITELDQPEGVDLPNILLTDSQEVDLVEMVLTHRAMYARSLAVLRDYYRDHGYHDKLKWAEKEMGELARVTPFKYILSAEVPLASLRPVESIAEADGMYQRGCVLMKEGGHGIPVLYRQDKMREALGVFTEMINRYPTSDKIDDAAFFCGEILKEYFQDTDRLALMWYERARTWNPQLPHPALFQSAVVYDYRLHDRAKALELYHRVLEEETDNKSNTAFASRRIYELTEDGQRAEATVEGSGGGSQEAIVAGRQLVSSDR